MPIELAAILKSIGPGRILESIWERFGRRIVVKEIKRATDSDIDETLELYERLFREEHRVPASDIIEWLRETIPAEGKHEKLEQCLLVAKRKGAVVGLLKALYCPLSGFVLISYFCIDKQSDAVSRKVASAIMMRFFKRFLKKRWGKNKGIVFEVDLPRPGLSKQELLECKARFRLFRDIARSQGRFAYKIKIDYQQPIVADSPSYKGSGKKMSLILIPAHTKEIHSLKKVEIEPILSFLFLNVYATTQKIPRKRIDNYNQYLLKLHSQTLSDIGDRIELEV